MFSLKQLAWSIYGNGIDSSSPTSTTGTLTNLTTDLIMANNNTCNFSYADDLGVTAQHTSFNQVETTVEKTLGELTLLQNKEAACQSG